MPKRTTAQSRVRRSLSYLCIADVERPERVCHGCYPTLLDSTSLLVFLLHFLFRCLITSSARKSASQGVLVQRLHRRVPLLARLPPLGRVALLQRAHLVGDVVLHVAQSLVHGRHLPLHLLAHPRQHPPLLRRALGAPHICRQARAQ